jgi:hypothetical protein
MTRFLGQIRLEMAKVLGQFVSNENAQVIILKC